MIRRKTGEQRYMISFITIITNNLIDKDGYKRDTALTNAIATKLDPKIQTKLEAFY